MIMLNFFDNKKVYGKRWSVKSVRNFTPEEVAMVKKTVIVDSQYGASCCFIMMNGTSVYSPLSIDSSYQVGDEPDINKLEIVTLEKVGEADIERIR